MLRRLLRILSRRGQWLAAGFAILTASLIAVSGSWVFRSRAVGSPDASLWRFLFVDGSTAGFVRLALIAISLYAIGSVAALVVGGRWMKALGAGGFHADEARESDQIIAELNARLEAHEEQIEFLRLFWRMHDG
jgi:hypothetical protein